jgi:hypothetical protein
MYIGRSIVLDYIIITQCFICNIYIAFVHYKRGDEVQAAVTTNTWTLYGKIRFTYLPFMAWLADWLPCVLFVPSKLLEKSEFLCPTFPSFEQKCKTGTEFTKNTKKVIYFYFPAHYYYLLAICIWDSEQILP